MKNAHQTEVSLKYMTSMAGGQKTSKLGPLIIYSTGSEGKHKTMRAKYSAPRQVPRQVNNQWRIDTIETTEQISMGIAKIFFDDEVGGPWIPLVSYALSIVEKANDQTTNYVGNSRGILTNKYFISTILFTINFHHTFTIAWRHIIIVQRFLPITDRIPPYKPSYSNSHLAIK